MFDGSIREDLVLPHKSSRTVANRCSASFHGDAGGAALVAANHGAGCHKRRRGVHNHKFHPAQHRVCRFLHGDVDQCDLQRPGSQQPPRRLDDFGPRPQHGDQFRLHQLERRPAAILPAGRAMNGAPFHRLIGADEPAST